MNKITMTGGGECPKCGEYGIFHYNLETLGEFWQCEGCLRKWKQDPRIFYATEIKPESWIDSIYKKVFG